MDGVCCANCLLMVKGKDPQQIGAEVMECHAGPPQVGFVVAANGAIARLAGFPQVTAQTWCAAHPDFWGDDAEQENPPEPA